MLKSIKDLVSEEIKSEEGLVAPEEQVAPDRIEEIIEEIMFYFDKSEGVAPDDEMDETEFGLNVDNLKATTIALYYFLRSPRWSTS
jgi:hypothetical protein